MLKVDVEPIAPRLLNNRTVQSDYLRLTQEQAAILREVVEKEKSQNPLNNSLDHVGVDLLTGSRGNNLYTMYLGDMMASSPICLLSKASKTKSWLWHQRLSHLNIGFVPNPPPSTPFVPPSRTNWDLLFPPLFDELLTHPPSVDHLALEVIALIAKVEAPELAASIGSPSSTTFDQDAPSPSNSQTIPKIKTLVISNNVEEDNHDLDVTYMNNDPFVEPKNFKQVMAKPSWIDAMQEEVHEFERPKYGMVSSDYVDTPLVEKSKMDEDLQGKSVDATLYHGMIRYLMYLTSNRPDLTYAVCLCAWTLDAVHQEVLNSYVINLLVSHPRSKNSSVLRQKSVIALCCNSIQHSRAKQIDVHYHFIKNQVENGIVELYIVWTEHQLADIFTKPLPRERFNFLIEKLGVKSMTLETLKRQAGETDE
nr:retrotransposon protein, putative, unclassified [Tanacetum cinerariifolium]